MRRFLSETIVFSLLKFELCLYTTDRRCWNFAVLGRYHRYGFQRSVDTVFWFSCGLFCSCWTFFYDSLGYKKWYVRLYVSSVKLFIEKCARLPLYFRRFSLTVYFMQSRLLRAKQVYRNIHQNYLTLALNACLNTALAGLNIFVK